MSTGKGINLGWHFGNREFFYILTNLLLVAFGWLAGWWLKGHSFAAYAQSNYFSNLFRNIFIFYIGVEAITELMTFPRCTQAADEVPHEWVHWRARMWETVLVVSVFSDCMGILPLNSGSLARLVGIALLAIGLAIFSVAMLARRKSLREVPSISFPTKNIFHFMRSPKLFQR